MRKSWAIVPGTEGWYEVSSRGRVRSWKRSRWGRRKTPKLMKLIPVAGGYLGITLVYTGGSKRVRIQQVVLRAFVGPPKPGQEARHTNGKRADNRLSNLKWGTRTENMADARRHGTLALGERNGHAKLTWRKVRAIRKRALKGEQSRILAQAYGVNDATMHDVVRNKSWVDPDYTPPRSRWGSRHTKRDEVVKLRRDGLSISAVAREVGVSRHTVRRILEDAAPQHQSWGAACH